MTSRRGFLAAFCGAVGLASIAPADAATGLLRRLGRNPENGTKDPKSRGSVHSRHRPETYAYFEEAPHVARWTCRHARGYCRECHDGEVEHRPERVTVYFDREAEVRFGATGGNAFTAGTVTGAGLRDEYRKAWARIASALLVLLVFTGCATRYGLDAGGAMPRTQTVIGCFNTIVSVQGDEWNASAGAAPRARAPKQGCLRWRSLGSRGCLGVRHPVTTGSAGTSRGRTPSPPPPPPPPASARAPQR